MVLVWAIIPKLPLLGLIIILNKIFDLIFRLGLIEMKYFARLFVGEKEVKDATFSESCGVADLITTCYGGRNRKVSEAFAKTGKPLAELETEMLNGQKLQATGF